MDQLIEKLQEEDWEKLDVRPNKSVIYMCQWHMGDLENALTFYEGEDPYWDWDPRPFAGTLRHLVKDEADVAHKDSPGSFVATAVLEKTWGNIVEELFWAYRDDKKRGEADPRRLLFAGHDDQHRIRPKHGGQTHLVRFRLREMEAAPNYAVVSWRGAHPKSSSLLRSAAEVQSGGGGEGTLILGGDVADR